MDGLQLAPPPPPPPAPPGATGTRRRHPPPPPVAAFRGFTESDRYILHGETSDATLIEHVDHTPVDVAEYNNW